MQKHALNKMYIIQWIQLQLYNAKKIIHNTIQRRQSMEYNALNVIHIVQCIECYAYDTMHRLLCIKNVYMYRFCAVAL